MKKAIGVAVVLAASCLLGVGGREPLMRWALKISDDRGLTCMASWGWSDPGWGLALGRTGPPGLPIDLYNFGGLNVPPAVTGGQLYTIPARLPSDSTQEPLMSLRVRETRRWRLSVNTPMTFKVSPIDINCEARNNPPPALLPVPARPPFTAAWEGELRAGWYFFEVYPVDPPTTKFLAEPVGAASGELS